MKGARATESNGKKEDPLLKNIHGRPSDGQTDRHLRVLPENVTAETDRRLGATKPRLYRLMMRLLFCKGFYFYLRPEKNAPDPLIHFFQTGPWVKLSRNARIKK